EGMTPDKIVDRLIQLISVDSSQEKLDGRLPQVFRSADAR
ncbi:MAG TPA: AAA family ATPase, partial [Planctomycetaceae bacterium]|nr:AAA family ATPase [Planctomycetaceae bacterium]